MTLVLWSVYDFARFDPNAILISFSLRSFTLNLVISKNALQHTHQGISSEPLTHICILWKNRNMPASFTGPVIHAHCINCCPLYTPLLMFPTLAPGKYFSHCVGSFQSQQWLFISFLIVFHNAVLIKRICQCFLSNQAVSNKY